MQKENKNTVSFYRIDRSFFPIKYTNKKIIEDIMGKADGFVEEKELVKNKINEFNISMFYSHSDTSYDKWELFFDGILTEGNNTFNIGKTKKYVGNYLSFAFFFEKEEYIFVIGMGKAYTAIDKYIHNDFGFNLLTCLIKADSNLIKQLTANHLAGSTLEDINFFRTSESFLSQDDFGKIFKQAISQLDREALTKLDMNTGDFELPNCIAKASFMLKAGISFSQIANKLLPAIITILSDPTKINFQINKVKEVTKYHPAYSDLKKELLKKIRSNILDFDFFAPDNSTEFFLAQKYSITKYSKTHVINKYENDLTTIEKLQNALNENKILNFKDQREFDVDIDFIFINAQDHEDNNRLKRSFNLLRGLHGEINFKGNIYFWMNGKFWNVDMDFLKDFNERVFENISNEAYRLSETIAFKDFDLTNNMPEGDYNFNHKDLKNFLSLDKKTPNGVEVCDLLYTGATTTYLIHIKKGFDRNIRDLASQILTAARFLSEDRGKNELLEKLYQDKSGNIDLTNHCSLDEFIDKFRNKLVFVFAISADINILDKSQFESNRSNIAKLEIFELLKQFKDFMPMYDLKIINLPTV